MPRLGRCPGRRHAGQRRARGRASRARPHPAPRADPARHPPSRQARRRRPARARRRGLTQEPPVPTTPFPITRVRQTSAQRVRTGTSRRSARRGWRPRARARPGEHPRHRGRAVGGGVGVEPGPPEPHPYQRLWNPPSRARPVHPHPTPCRRLRPVGVLLTRQQPRSPRLLRPATNRGRLTPQGTPRPPGNTGRTTMGLTETGRCGRARPICSQPHTGRPVDEHDRGPGDSLTHARDCSRPTPLPTSTMTLALLSWVVGTDVRGRSSSAR